MARRSPMNERYQKNRPSGKTRRSASSAKIKRPEAPASKPKRSGVGLVPQTPEIKRLRRIWWALMGVALLFASSIFIPAVRGNQRLTQVALVFELVALGLAVWIDWKKIRPLRQEAIEKAKRERKEK